MRTPAPLPSRLQDALGSLSARLLVAFLVPTLLFLALTGTTIYGLARAILEDELGTSLSAIAAATHPTSGRPEVRSPSPAPRPSRLQIRTTPMRLRACIALLLFLPACTTTPPSPGEPAARDPRLANLQRAATLPWMDGGRCAVREASEPWPVLAERCFHDLDHDRLTFHDTTGRCAVASTEAAAVGLGVCVLATPEIVVGAVIVAGVVVGFAIKETLDTYAEKRGRPQVRPAPETRPVPETKPVPQEPSPKKRPKPEPKGPDFPPVGPTEVTERERRPECKPLPVPHRGGNKDHNKCADRIQNNSFPGWDVLVNGKQFDALQLTTRTLWEVKTDDFEKQPPRSQKFFAISKLPARGGPLPHGRSHGLVLKCRPGKTTTTSLSMHPCS